MKLNRLSLILALLTIISVGQSQTQFKAGPSDQNSILIEGTSNIHDWEMVAEEFTSQMDLALAEGELDKINSIQLSIPVKGLKSGKSKMDKNAYEAMNANDYKMIKFSSSSASEVTKTPTGVYKTTIKGRLQISGVSKTVQIPVELHKSSSGYTLKAEQALKMTDHKVDPPKALFGTITTGDGLNVIFNLTHYKY